MLFFIDAILGRPALAQSSLATRTGVDGIFAQPATPQQVLRRPLRPSAS